MIIKNEYEGTVFYRDDESAGFFRNLTSTTWAEMISWTYYDDSDRLVLTVEQWGDNKFEAAVGMVVNENAFSNILPV